MAGDHIEAEGVIIKAQGKGNFLVKTTKEAGESIITCKLSGKIRKHNIKVIEGDMVSISISPYDLTRGFITYRVRA